MVNGVMTAGGAAILAIETQFPDQVLTNAEIEARQPQWRMSELVQRTGVYSRHWSGPEETSLDLAERACVRLFERTKTSSDAIDAILFCTQTPDFVMPPNACLLQARLRIPTRIAAFDFSLACSGFIYGLYVAKALVDSGAADRVLLVTAETYSKLVSADDRGPATLFGDGAAATLIGRGASSISRVLVGTDGSKPETFCVPAGGARRPRNKETCIGSRDSFGNVRSAEQIVMDGAGVLAFVQRELVPFVRQTIASLGTSVADLDLIVFHQASKAALDMLQKRLDIPTEKMVVNMAEVGNTVSASIPIALREAEADGRLRAGMKVLLVGFGVGLSWGACVVTWR